MIANFPVLQTKLTTTGRSAIHVPVLKLSTPNSLFPSLDVIISVKLGCVPLSGKHIPHAFYVSRMEKVIGDVSPHPPFGKTQRCKRGRFLFCGGLLGIPHDFWLMALERVSQSTESIVEIKQGYISPLCSLFFTQMP